MADTYNALYGPELGYPGDAGYFRTPMRQPNALIGPVWENSHAAPQQAPQRPADWAVTSGVAEAISPTMGAYGMGAGIGQTYNALSRGDYAGAAEAGLPLAAMALMPGPKGMGKLPAAADQPKGIRAYHGSPHDFDKFDISKIGTGEGAQAYGHGLYFAENEDVARGYRDTLARKFAKVNWDGSTITTPSEWSAMTRALEDSGDWRSAKLANHYANLGGTTDYRLKQLTDWYRDQPEMMAALDRMRQRINVAPEQGKMYEVNINADPEHFLDWDKPLSQQHQTVQNALAQHGINAPEKNASRAFDDALLAALEGDGSTTLPKQPHDPMGEQIIRQLYSKRGSSWLDPNKGAEQVASQALRDAGIPGIRYLDQGSRGAGEGSRNYVVFDPATIEILRKYGLLGPMAGGVGVNALYGSENQ